MPIYFFNIYNDDVTEDYEGRDLADAQAARAYAVQAARALAAETVVQGHLIGSHRIEIVDSDRKPIGTVRFKDAVRISVD